VNTTALALRIAINGVDVADYLVNLATESIIHNGLVGAYETVNPGTCARHIEILFWSVTRHRSIFMIFNWSLRLQILSLGPSRRKSDTSACVHSIPARIL
jgi:hypothetical protein